VYWRIFFFFFDFFKKNLFSPVSARISLCPPLFAISQLTHRGWKPLQQRQGGCRGPCGISVDRAARGDSGGIVRTATVIRETSLNAALVFVTMPVPGYEADPGLYLAWLDEMGRDMPPLLFIRGNQSSVLTHVM
jgi:hypothetical protein